MSVGRSVNGSVSVSTCDEAASRRRAVHRGEPRALLGGRGPEHRVGHAKRTKNTLFEKRFEGFARPDLDKPPEHGRPLAVPVPRAGFLHQRHAHQIGDELRHRDRARSHLLAPVDFRCSGIEAGRVQQQVAHCHRLHGRARLNALIARHDDVLELGDESGNGIVELEAALFVKHHHRDRSDGPRHRVDAKERSFGHRRARLQILNADGFEIRDLPASRDGRHGAGNPLLGNIAVQQSGRLTETRGRQAGRFRRHASCLLPRCRRRRRRNGDRRDQQTSSMLSLPAAVCILHHLPVRDDLPVERHDALDAQVALLQVLEKARREHVDLSARLVQVDDDERALARQIGHQHRLRVLAG